MTLPTFTGVTIDELKALERKIYTDLLAGGTTNSYSVRDQMFTFSSLSQSREFLLFLQSEIAKREAGGGFSLARFAAV
jgi:hypothetical protein